MQYKKYFIELISSFLAGELSREEVAHQVAMELPIDNDYRKDIELMENCEMALRHINEHGYWTTETELEYYLLCLKGDKQFSHKIRDDLLASL